MKKNHYKFRSTKAKLLQLIGKSLISPSEFVSCGGKIPKCLIKQIWKICYKNKISDIHINKTQDVFIEKLEIVI